MYNQCLDKKIKAYTNDKVNLGLKELGNYFHQELTKDEDYVWLAEHNTKVLKQSVINLLDSYKRFFVNGTGFPKFKSKHDNVLSCRFPIEAISKKNDYKSGRLTLSGIKNIKFKTSDKSDNGSRWIHISFSLEKNRRECLIANKINGKWKYTKY